MTPETNIIDLQLERERRQAQAVARRMARRDLARIVKTALQEKARFESWVRVQKITIPR